MSLLGFVLKSVYPEEDGSLLSSSYTMVLTLQSAVQATVDLFFKTVCLKLLFGDVNIFSIVLSEKDNFLNVLQFVFLCN